MPAATPTRSNWWISTAPRVACLRNQKTTARWALVECGVLKGGA